MAHQAVLDFEYPDRSHARIVERSVSIEAGDIEGDRTTASVDREDTVLTVTIDAEDLVALRAGVNTWCSLVEVAEECAGASSA